MNMENELEKIGFRSIDCPRCLNCRHLAHGLMDEGDYCSNEKIGAVVRDHMAIGNSTVCDLYEQRGQDRPECKDSDKPREDA